MSFKLSIKETNERIRIIHDIETEEKAVSFGHLLLMSIYVESFKVTEVNMTNGKIVKRECLNYKKQDQ